MADNRDALDSCRKTDSAISVTPEDYSQILEELESEATHDVRSQRGNYKSVDAKFKVLEEITDNDIENNINVSQIKNKLKMRNENLIAKEQEVKKLLGHVEAHKKKEKHLDGVIKRHQGIVDQLMQDKMVLNSRCEEIFSELQTREEKYKSQLRSIEIRHKEEIRKARDMAAAAEKARQDNLVANERKKAKESACKSIENELISMQKRMEEKETNLKAVHEEELRTAELSNRKKLQEEVEKLRERMTAEKEAAILHEKRKLEIWYYALLDADKKSFDHQKVRWSQEREERNKECEERERAANEEKAAAIARAKLQAAEEMKNYRESHQRTIVAMRKGLEVKFKNYCLQLTEKWNRATQRKMKAMEQDWQEEKAKQIEEIIDEFHAENEKLKREKELSVITLKKEYEDTISQVKTHMSEVRSIGCDLLDNLDKKCKDYQAKLVKEQVETNSQRAHYLEKIETLEAEKAKMKNDYEAEVVNQNKKVKEIINKKDAAIEKLKRQLAELEEVFNEHLNNSLQPTDKTCE